MASGRNSSAAVHTIDRRLVVEDKVHFADTLVVAGGARVGGAGLHVHGGAGVSSPFYAGAAAEGAGGRRASFPSQVTAVACGWDVVFCAFGGGSVRSTAPDIGDILPPPDHVAHITRWGETLRWQQVREDEGVLFVGAAVRTSGDPSHACYAFPFCASPRPRPRPSSSPMPFALREMSPLPSVVFRIIGSTYFVESIAPNGDLRSYRLAAPFSPPSSASPPPSVVRGIRCDELHVWRSDVDLTLACHARTGRVTIVMPNSPTATASFGQQGAKGVDAVPSRGVSSSPFLFSSGPSCLVRCSVRTREVDIFRLPSSHTATSFPLVARASLSASSPPARIVALSHDSFLWEAGGRVYATSSSSLAVSSFPAPSGWDVAAVSGDVAVAAGKDVRIVRPPFDHNSPLRTDAIVCEGKVECAAVTVRGGVLSPGGVGEIMQPPCPRPIPPLPAAAAACAWMGSELVVACPEVKNGRGGILVTGALGWRAAMEGVREGEALGAGVAAWHDPAYGAAIVGLSHPERPQGSTIRISRSPRYAPHGTWEDGGVVSFPPQVLGVRSVALAGRVAVCVCEMRAGRRFEAWFIDVATGGACGLAPVALPFISSAPLRLVAAEGMVCVAEWRTAAVAFRLAFDGGSARVAWSQELDGCVAPAEVAADAGTVWAAGADGCRVRRFSVSSSGVVWDGDVDVAWQGMAVEAVVGSDEGRVTALRSIGDGRLVAAASSPPRLVLIDGRTLAGVWRVASAVRRMDFHPSSGLATVDDEGRVDAYPATALTPTVRAPAVSCGRVNGLRVGEMPYALSEGGRGEGGGEGTEARVLRLERRVEELVGILCRCGVAEVRA